MSSELYARATAGVYAEVINQIYDSLDKRIREAVLACPASLVQLL